MLVTVTDELATGSIREEANIGDLFQVMIGVSPDAAEDELFLQIIAAVERAVELAPLSEFERDRIFAAIANGDGEG